ncbi:hypothetical protein HID58_028841 [Brassica napus]|uniref:Uncharacterized protein n=3 Tax=Brassica TaxID=3705 RepID=A0ABQ8CDB9_BRANA|nr:hypothetical protein HID58_028841 [Brassica napus]
MISNSLSHNHHDFKLPSLIKLGFKHNHLKTTIPISNFMCAMSSKTRLAEKKEKAEASEKKKNVGVKRRKEAAAKRRAAVKKKRDAAKRNETIEKKRK